MPLYSIPSKKPPIIVHHPKPCCQSLGSPRRRKFTTKAGIYLPHLLGGVLHWRSIWVSARVHSCSHAVASLSAPDGEGLRPPHIVGFTARSRACFLMRFLWRVVVSVMARRTSSSYQYKVCCAIGANRQAKMTYSFLILVSISQQ